MVKTLREKLTRVQALQEALKPSPVTGVPTITPDSLAWLWKLLDADEREQVQAAFAQRCDACEAPLDTLTTGIAVVRSGAQQLTVCASCARRLEAQGFHEVARAKSVGS